MYEILKISLIAYVFQRLTEPEEIFYYYGKMIEKLPIWLWKPLGGCVKCFTGQVCFWYYLLKYFGNYSLIDHMFFCTAGIFLTFIYDIIYERTKNYKF